MKKLAAICGLVLAFLALAGAWGKSCLAAEKETAAGGSEGLLLRWHHIGQTALAQATNANTLRQIGALPATEALRSQLSSNLARATVKIWQKDLPTGAADPTAYLQPLLQDFLTSEAGVQVRGPIGRTETVLAIELSDARAALWNTNLWQLMRYWKLGEPRAVTVEGVAGWELKRNLAPNLFQVFRTGKWLILGLGQDKLTLSSSWLQQSKQKSRPLPALGSNLLDVQADLPALRGWLPVLQDFPLAPARLTMTGRGENVRTEVRFQFPGKVPWTFEPWKIPTNLVSEPLASFTVGRGVSALLGRIKGMKDLGLNPLPNQFCSWSVTNELARLYFTVPVADATNAIKTLAPGLAKVTVNRFGSDSGSFLYHSNRAELVWAKAFIQPFLKAARGADSQYLFGGVFFLPPRHTPAPPDLYAQLANRSDLLYYDWELTGHRLMHSTQLYDLANMMASRKPAPATTASKKWMTAVSPRLHDAVTEITQTAPQELLLVRKSGLGFSGFELASFSAWLDSPGFPFRIDPQPLISRKAGVGNSRTNTNQTPIRPALPPAP